MEGAGEAVHVVGGDDDHGLRAHRAQNFEQIGVDAHPGAVQGQPALQEVVTKPPVELDAHLGDDLIGRQQTGHPLIRQTSIAGEDPGHPSFQLRVPKAGASEA